MVLKVNIRCVLHISDVRIPFDEGCPAINMNTKRGFKGNKDILFFAVSIVEPCLCVTGNDEETLPVIRVFYIVYLPQDM